MHVHFSLEIYIDQTITSIIFNRYSSTYNRILIFKAVGSNSTQIQGKIQNFNANFKLYPNRQLCTAFIKYRLNIELSFSLIQNCNVMLTTVIFYILT